MLLYNQVDRMFWFAQKEKKGNSFDCKVIQIKWSLLKLTLYEKEEYLKSSQDKEDREEGERVSHFFPQRKRERERDAEADFTKDG